MADQSVALQIKPFDAVTPLAAARDYQTAQISNEGSQLTNQYNREANPIKLQSLNRANAVEDIQFRNQLMSSAFQRGSINSDAWDDEMQRAKDAGAPEAGQWIGRYPGPVQAARVAAAYTGAPSTGTAGAAGASPAAGGAPPQGDVVQQLQNLTPEQAAAALKRTTMISDSLASIRDQKTQDAAIASLRAAGIPINPDANRPFNAFDIYTKWNNLQPIKNQLQNIVDANTVGVPSQRVMPDKAEKIGVNDYGSDVIGVRDPYAPGGFRRIDAASAPSTNPQSTAGGGISIEDAAKRIAPTENATGNPAATNPRSSAMGNSQFIDKTWLDTVKAAKPAWAEGMSDKQILALRAVPGINDAMTVELAKQNAGVLTNAHVPLTSATIALAHKFGAPDAIKIFNASPDTPMDRIVSPDVIKANPELKGQTAGTYAQGLVRQVGRDPINIDGGAGTPTVASQLSSAAATGEGTPAATPKDALQLHGEDYLKTLPPKKAGIVRQIVEGRSEFPAGFIMKTSYGQWLSQAVAQAEPGFTQADFNTRRAVQKEWNAGGPNSPAGNLTAGNTAIQHLGKLSDAAEKLENWSGWGALNSPLNWATLKERDIAQDPRVSNFDSIRNKYIEEATKFYRGTGGTEADLQRDIHSLNAAQSPEQLRQAIAVQAELMQSKVNALQDRWIHANTLHDGRVIAPPFPIMQKESKSALAKIKDRENATGSAPVAAAKTPEPPQVDPRDAAALRANSHNPAASAAIDKKYGPGTAVRLLGE